MPEYLPYCLQPAGSPLHYGEEDPGKDLDQELMLFEEEEVGKLCPDLDSSLLLSDKLSLSLNQGNDEEEKQEGGGECEGDCSEEEVDDYEASDSIGIKLLENLDCDFYASPRMLVRGVYRGDVLELTVKRRTDGNLVSWTLREMVHKKYVLNVKAKMLYSYDIAGGHKYGHRMRGGRGWEGFGYGFCNLFEGSDTSVKHVDLHEAVFFEDSVYYHYSGDNCRRVSEDITCKEPGCGTRVWSLEIKTFSTVAQERGLYDISCNLRKEKLLEQVYLSMIAFFNGTYELVLHRKGVEKSFIEVAWLRKDNTAQFDDKPDVDRAVIDNRSYFIWQTKVPKMSEKPSRNIDEHEFAPEVSSTPVKASRSNRGVYSSSRTPEKGIDDNYAGQDSILDREEIIECLTDDNYEVEKNDEDSQWQDKLTECDACHVRGRIANHLRGSDVCLKELRSRPALRMKGRDEMFILKTALIIGECPSPHCHIGRHEEIPEECVSWWKREGWDILGWKGAKADADAKIITAKINQMLTNRRKRGAPEVPQSQEAQCSQPPQDSSGTGVCRSCEYRGDLVQHLNENHQCFAAIVKHYISKDQPDNNDDFTRRKLMFELSAVLKTCARIQCTSREGIRYIGTHLALNVQCLQFYQTEGALLNLPNWNLEASPRIIGRKLSQMRRKIKESKQKEDSRGCNYFREEIGKILSHVCFKCGTMGPVVKEESFQITRVGTRDDGLELWQCSKCSNQSLPYDELRQTWKNRGEKLRSGDPLQERELKAVTLPGSGNVIFAPSTLTEGHIDGPYDGPSFSSVVLVPSQTSAIETIIKECDKACEEKNELDKYVEDLLNRPIIIDFQDFLSCPGLSICIINLMFILFNFRPGN